MSREPEPKDGIAVGIIDDDPLAVTCLTALLSAAQVRVLWSCLHPDEALGQLGDALALPDVLAVDIRMPQIDGYALTRLVKRKFPDLPIVMLTSLREPAALRNALEAGACGYMVKSDPPASLALGLKAACSGLRPLSATVPMELGATAPKVNPSPLTPRETDVLNYLAMSFTNDQIARRLRISPETVKSHVSAILRKLDVPDRVGAVVWGIRNRIVR
ncbi:response regulator transcription factor [uncultured Tessaracoccus sp.]|uniref:response regulator n=1 Tax=uncultured Tessaracoccus sp. TaxID=905023 RepID=UPI002619B090|nr:response regulator transcription factor [uncultured Tessaracoccus sp.]